MSLDLTKATAALSMIAADMESDTLLAEGLPFTGRNVSEQFGNHAAAIAALANILRLHIEGSAGESP